jgi:hypothetical protein
VPTSLVPADLLSQLDSCDGDDVCVPDDFIVTAGQTIPASCVSTAGAEGRCLSTCLPSVAAAAQLLPTDGCPPEHACVPCYDPFQGELTGACNLACDPGPIEPPVTLPECCDAMGSCLAEMELPEGYAEAFAKDDCVNGELCVPDELAIGSYQAQPCTTSTIASMFGPEYGPGACMHACLAAMKNSFLKQDGCADGFKCAPCTNPLDDTPTGACNYL